MCISRPFDINHSIGLDIITMTGKTLSVKGVFGVSEIKEQIQRLDGTPAHLQQITCNGVELADKICLSRYDYCWDSVYIRWKDSGDSWL